MLNPFSNSGLNQFHVHEAVSVACWRCEYGVKQARCPQIGTVGILICYKGTYYSLWLFILTILRQCYDQYIGWYGIYYPRLLAFLAIEPFAEKFLTRKWIERPLENINTNIIKKSAD